MDYAKDFSTRETPQTEPIPGTAQVPNAGGGFAWAVDDWTRLDRFLILGAEGGTYYASQKALTLENAQAVLQCVKADGVRVVARATDISVSGRAPKNDPAIFVLAMAAGLGDERTRAVALDAVPKVCRIGTHLFHFAQAVQAFRGWGRGLKRAIGDWYDQPAERLAYQAVKYRQRDGWTHADLLSLAHVRPATAEHQALFRWINGSTPIPTEERKTKRGVRLPAYRRFVGQSGDDALARLPLLAAFEEAQTADAKRVCVLIRDFDLPREAVPGQLLNDPDVWTALLERMPMTAMIRNLGKMASVGILGQLSEGQRLVTAALGDAARIKDARVHPIALLSALLVYAQGHGERGSLAWGANAAIVDALDAAFYLAFGNVQPTGKRRLLALDVSGSMNGGTVAGVPGLTPRMASAAMALVTAAVEPQHAFVAFSHALIPVAISPRQRLDDVMRLLASIPMGATDCSLPMLWALAVASKPAGPVIESFEVYTDSETNTGRIHPAQALLEYRRSAGVPAKLVVVAMTSGGFSIADPNDAGMLDVVGFDTAAPEVMADFVRH